MKSHKVKLYILAALVSLAMFSSCSSDEKEEFQATPNQTDLVGSWYFEDSDGSNLNRIIYHYFSDGTYTFEAINMAGLLDNKVTKEKGSGIYHVSNQELRRGQNAIGCQGWLDPVTYTREGSKLTLQSKFDLSNQTFNLIVDSCHIQKGETITFNYNGEYGQPREYSTSSALVASVSENGQIKANELGEAYITGHCKDNDVVIKITVDNGDKVTPDFMDDIWMPRDSIINKYGDKYVNGEYYGIKEQLNYIYGSDQIHHIVFGFNKKERVRAVGITYWPSTNMSAIKAYLDKNYTYWGDNDNGRLYVKRIGQRVFECTLDTLKRTAYYGIEQVNFDEFDEAIYYTVDEVISKCLTGTQVITNLPGYIEVQIGSNEIFERMGINYNYGTRSISQIQLKAQANVTVQDLLKWAYSNYPYVTAQDGTLIFVNRSDTWNMKPFVGMTVITYTDGRVGLNYYK